MLLGDEDGRACFLVGAGKDAAPYGGKAAISTHPLTPSLWKGGRTRLPPEVVNPGITEYVGRRKKEKMQITEHARNTAIELCDAVRAVSSFSTVVVMLQTEDGVNLSPAGWLLSRKCR